MLGWWWVSRRYFLSTQQTICWALFIQFSARRCGRTDAVHAGDWRLPAAARCPAPYLLWIVPSAQGRVQAYVPAGRARRS